MFRLFNLLINLPKKIYYKFLKLIGMKFFADISVLNLIGNKEILNIKKKFDKVDFHIFYVKLFGIKSNIILIGKLRENL